MQNTYLMALPSPTNGFRAYLREVNSMPALDADKERELAEQLRDSSDRGAAWQLVTSHLRYVVSIARGYDRYGLPQEDLIQEGNIGLMKAVKRFDPSRGARLATYAAYWIRAAIHEFILRNWRIVKIATTKAKRKLFYNLRSCKQKIKWLDTQEAQTIAESLQVKTKDVVDMEGILYGHDESFDSSVDDESFVCPSRVLADESNTPEAAVLDAELLRVGSRVLADALISLSDRKREIIERRWLVEETERATLASLGDKFGVSKERVRQLEVDALQQLKQQMSHVIGSEPTCLGA